MLPIIMDMFNCITSNIILIVCCAADAACCIAARLCWLLSNLALTRMTTYDVAKIYLIPLI